MDLPPLPRQQREQDAVDDGEALSVVARCSTGEHRQQREQTHLQEDVVPAAPVLTAMQLVPQRAVEPRQPDQPEHHRELEHAASGDVFGEMMRRAPDQDHVDEVVEQLEEADLAFVDDLAMTSRWRAKPAPHSVANPSAADLAHQRARRRSRRLLAERLITVVRHHHGHIFASGGGIREPLGTGRHRQACGGFPRGERDQPTPLARHRTVRYGAVVKTLDELGDTLEALFGMLRAEWGPASAREWRIRARCRTDATQ